MSTPTDTVLLVGSPRGAKSTSASLGGYLLSQLAARGLPSRVFALSPIGRDNGEMGAVLAAVDHADLVVLAFPVYVDCPPAHVIAALEQIAARRKDAHPTKTQMFVAIANCGFPEAAHTEVALAICRQFAAQAGFQYAGGLGMGMGGAIDGRDMAETGGAGRYARKALSMAAADLAEGRAVADEAIRLMAKAPMPQWLYAWSGNRGWKRQAQRNRALDRLDRRPYQPRAVS